MQKRLGTVLLVLALAPTIFGGEPPNRDRDRDRGIDLPKLIKRILLKIAPLDDLLTPPRP